ncbi:ribosomal protein S18-alanine N-acetyltransferase [Halalkalibacter akibai]|uniref:[Ribosomal protein bS18]-alanine N-acetyltransferase n=1 Tax=Halalkalibacter akibai (strain ATCC 43226 / DSM 21942 / CIP 109018 / JCM 9157 / 1139) TaxID=1236973 RepID=W4R023_HALA3|nr:ribosomal protein S18-alanine N-acetyltransferase [Halalkalibacter akibai]GAE37268.1 ribosomal-protein-S18p-alanine acetyltransferase [Halalkalibacter akibai JCM 9157]
MIDQAKATIRFMTLEDLDAVVEVERNSFSTPWDPGIFRNEITSNQFAHYLVYELNDEIIGYCGLWIVMDEAQITNIAIHSKHRGYKHGERLLSYVIAFVKQMGVLKLSLEVRVSNNVAQSLYRKMGFQEGGVRKNYYADNGEDALVMWVNVNEGI